MRLFVYSLVLVVVFACGIVTAASHPVSLNDAEAAPTYLVYLWPHAKVTYTYHDGAANCPGGGYFTNVSAYTWRGNAVGPQHWNRIHDLIVWKTHSGRVTFNGITFHNSSRAPVLVAGWCDMSVQDFR